MPSVMLNAASELPAYPSRWSHSVSLAGFVRPVEEPGQIQGGWLVSAGEGRYACGCSEPALVPPRVTSPGK